MKDSTIRKMRLGDWTSYYGQMVPQPVEATGRIGTTSDDVRNLKNRVDASVESTNRDFAACVSAGKSDENTWKAWMTFYASWKAYVGSDDSWWLGFGTGGIYDAGLTYEQQLIAWQAKIKETCKLSGPDHKPSTNESTEELTSTLKVLGVGAGILGGALLLRSFAK